MYLSRYHVQHRVVDLVNIGILGRENGSAIQVSWLLIVCLDVPKIGGDKAVNCVVGGEHVWRNLEFAVAGCARRATHTSIPDLEEQIREICLVGPVLTCMT